MDAPYYDIDGVLQLPFDAEVLIGEGVTRTQRDDATRYVKRHEIFHHHLPAGYQYGITPVSYPRRFIDVEAYHVDIVALAYRHFITECTQPLIIELHSVTRVGALIAAMGIEACLTVVRDHVPYTITWWYRPVADGKRDIAYFGLDHIGLEALVGT